MGCGGDGARVPDKLSLEPHASGDNQAGLFEEVLVKPLRVLVQGPQIPGMLGGKGSRSPIPDIETTFRIENPGSGAVFDESGTSTFETRTGVDGIASARVRLGDHTGDVRVIASIETPSGSKTVLFRALAGIEVFGNGQEAATGGSIEGVGVRVYQSPGQPASGVSVYFTAEDSSFGASRVETDVDGFARTQWTLGKSSGTYKANIEIRDYREEIAESQRLSLRAISITANAMDMRGLLVVLFGGLAVFIFGMKLMSGGLQRMADRRLKGILQAMTRNTPMAIAMGAGLTALIQSSSATTVMTVGFVNAGMVTLTQAIGVIFGANIGTTITAQMIAFKLTSLAYPAIAVGLILNAFSKRPGVKFFGEATLGFGLLFLGMMTMSDILMPLRHSSAFMDLFQMFDCTPGPSGFIPWKAALMCVGIGAFVTVIVQSSSASIGLVLALCGQGLIPFETAFPIILGDNIGTTITAVLASFGANRNAKRAALAHTMFNVFGAFYMYVLLFVPLWNGQPLFLGFIDAITPGDVFGANPENLPRHVANAHTAFNVLNCLLFFPFVALMAKVCQRVIPITDEDRDSVLEYLEPHLLKTPSVALELATKEVVYMVRRAHKSINDGCNYFLGGPEEHARNIAAREELIDRLQSEITSYLVELSQQPLTPEESTLLPALIHAVNDAERIGDRSENLVELTQLRRQDKLPFTEYAEEDIKAFQKLINQQFHGIYATLEGGKAERPDTVKNLRKQMHELAMRAADDHVKRLEAGTCDVQSGVIFLDFISNLERVGSHIGNIEERLVKLVNATAV